MAINVEVPQLGESIIEATVVRWLKKEGELVKAGEPIVELETEKANFEVGAEKTGILARIERKEGEDVKVGDVLCVIEEISEEEKKALREEPAVKPAPKETPKEAEEKPSEIPAEEEPALKKKITPVAKRLAEEHGIGIEDIEKVAATGPGNRITKEDIQRYIEQRTQQKEAPVTEEQKVYQLKEERLTEKADIETPLEAPQIPPLQRYRREERVRMSRRRRTIARRMLEAQRTAAILSTFNEIDMSAVMEIRRRRKEYFRQKYGVSLGITSFFVKAVIAALKEFPLLNAEIQDDEIVIKYYYDIGVAIGATGGLVVPVLRDADRMSFADIERAIKEFAEKAEKGTLSLEELQGGTFTVTNGGVFGSLLSTPILNPPQVGILGLHKIEERPVVVNHEIVIRPMMYVALSYDHRIVDGREAVQFLVRVKELIEDPESLFLEG